MENRLTEGDVQTLGDGMHSDGGYLWLRVRGSARSWIVRGPRDERGKKREAGLGPAKEVSLQQARSKRDRQIFEWRAVKAHISNTTWERWIEDEIGELQTKIGELSKIINPALKKGQTK